MNLPFLRIALMIARGSFVAPVERAVNRTAAKTGIWIAFGAIALLFVVVALVAVSLGAYLALVPYLQPAGAAFAVAGGGLVLALIALGVAALLAGRVDAPADKPAPAPAPAPAASAAQGDDPLDTLLKTAATNPTVVAAGALLLGFLVGRRR
ncbi:hypothetical protein ACRC7T_16150 [Segnochrobactraceae bacterium EtOH-i3]